MATDQPEEEEKRMTLRMTQALWKRLRIEAGHRDVSTTQLINDLLQQGIDEAEAQRKTA